MRLCRVLFMVVGVLAIAATWPATAQETGVKPGSVEAGSIGIVPDAASDVPEPAPDWGTDQWIGYYVDPCDVVDRDASGVGINLENCTAVEPAGTGTVYAGFPIHLPQGANVQYIRIYYYGNDASLSIGASFVKVTNTGQYSFVQVIGPPATDAGPTYEQFGPFSETIDNSPGGYTYSILASLQRNGSSTTKIYKVYLYYKLQVSPAPATATFNDVPVGAFGFQYVEALAASGITAGCGGGNFCPNDPLTRVQMAVFLSKALGLHWQY